jgi:hypothetical protein
VQHMHVRNSPLLGGCAAQLIPSTDMHRMLFASLHMSILSDQTA